MRHIRMFIIIIVYCHLSFLLLLQVKYIHKIKEKNEAREPREANKAYEQDHLYKCTN